MVGRVVPPRWAVYRRTSRKDPGASARLDIRATQDIGGLMTTQDNQINDVARLLEMEIIFGQLHPNQRLVEDELMARFDRTRHKVRRAIDMLATSGLVVREANKGAHVCSYSAQQVREMYDLRNILQTAALQKIEFPVPDALVEALTRLHEDHVAASAADALEDVFHLNNQFHTTLFQACRSDTLVEVIDTYATRSHPIRSQNFADPVYMGQAQADHAAMIDALRGADTARLVAISHDHTIRPMQSYLKRHVK